MATVDSTTANYGFCQCGCGQKTNLAPGTSKRLSRVKGEPYEFVHGHNGRVDIAVRLWSKVAITANPDKCWEWQGCVSEFGYGEIGKAKGKGFSLTHRVAYELAYGAIPDGLWVLHKCDNPPCCNPAHLFLGTDLDNMRDKVKKGRQSFSKGEKSGRSKLTDEKVLYIRERFAKGDITKAELGRQMNISPFHIGYIVTRKSWKHI